MTRLAPILVALLLGCSGSGSGGSSGNFAPVISGLIAVPYQRPPGLPPLQPPPPPPSQNLALSAPSQVVAHVGSATLLSVVVTDAITGATVQGALVQFSSTDRSRITDGGTTTSDATGTASAFVIPLVAGTSVESVLAVPQAYSGPVAPQNATTTITVVAR